MFRTNGKLGLSLMQAILNALSFMPVHRQETSKRAAMLGLDDLLDDARQMHKVDGNTLDLILMGYRLHAPASLSIQKFLKGKSLKPKALHDLLVLCFAALLTRDRTPHALIVNSFVDAASKRFGTHTKGLVNAFARGLLRSEVSLTELSRHPHDILPAALCKRWEKQAELLEIFSKRMGVRPETGVGAFGSELQWQRRPLSEWQALDSFQALDEGSWGLVQWILQNLKNSNSQVENFLDTCAAPGGKFIALSSQLAKQGLKKACATESKYPRLKRLEENVNLWKKTALKDQDIHLERFTWGEDELSPALKNNKWDLVLLDLPCSGSGTLHTRPDLLLEAWWERIPNLKIIQQSIIEAAHKLKAKNIFISICSVDPEEIEHVSKIVGKPPSWSSFNSYASDQFVEGLTAWH
jgi:hypothetical protein